MLFNSIQFFIFFPIVVGLYFLLPHRYRWILLLGASYYFYMSWKPEYVILIIVSTLIGYAAARLMSATDDAKKRKAYLFASLGANLCILFGFKYANFFSESVDAVLRQFNMPFSAPVFHILLPVGISFYTFQILSYTVDVYRRNIQPMKHVGIFALYVSFFPQLVAGPIERAGRLLPQFFEKQIFSYGRALDGLALMLWGLFKKVVIADNVAEIVAVVYNNPQQFNGVHFILATVYFAIQIFCDFSAYSDMAVGTAKVMGFELTKNFNRPYVATSIADFWRRWHISLSDWLQDYVYIPLGGSRKGAWRTYCNILVTFFISGLWHGAAWTYVAWGALHGAYLVVGRATKQWRERATAAISVYHYPRIRQAFQTATVFSLVSFSWIFFRAKTMQDALFIVRHLLTGVGEFVLNLSHLNYIKDVLGKLDVSPARFMTIGFFLLFFIGISFYQKSGYLRDALAGKPVWLRWSLYYALIFSILFFGNAGKQPFIYFQF